MTMSLQYAFVSLYACFAAVQNSSATITLSNLPSSFVTRTTVENPFLAYFLCAYTMRFVLILNLLSTCCFIQARCSREPELAKSSPCSKVRSFLSLWKYIHGCITCLESYSFNELLYLFMEVCDRISTAIHIHTLVEASDHMPRLVLNTKIFLWKLNAPAPLLRCLEEYSCHISGHHAAIRITYCWHVT